MSASGRLTQRIDLWLLASLEALVDECSVTRAAERLGTTQPAMSNSLSRLRSLLDDPILVKTSTGLAATPRALDLVRATAPARRGIENALHRSMPFDLSSTPARVVLGMMDPHSTFVLPPLFEAAAREAANLEIVTRLPEHTRIRHWLETGGCDVAIGYFPDLPVDLRYTVLYEDSVSVVSRGQGSDLPLPLTLEAYLGRRHLAVGAPFSPLTTLETVLNRTLKSRGLRRQTAGSVPSFSLAFFVAAQSPLLINMPTEYSRYFARLLPLRLDPLPVKGIEIQVLMVWHERSHHEPAQQWVRATIREIFKQLGFGARPVAAA